MPKSVCQEAQELTTGNRRGDYGHPLDNFQITVDLINARFGTKFTPEDFAEIMILCKIARQANASKRDNFVDIAGYANTHQMVIEERQRRNGPIPVATLKLEPKAPPFTAVPVFCEHCLTELKSEKLWSLENQILCEPCFRAKIAERPIPEPEAEAPVAVIEPAKMTVRDYLMELDEPYRTLALKNTDSSPWLKGNEEPAYPGGTHALGTAFDWGATPEGAEFWAAVSSGDKPEVPHQN